ncbi:MAG: hypothetical protein V4737_14205, partial [Curtobacterium sp.]
MSADEPGDETEARRTSKADVVRYGASLAKGAARGGVAGAATAAAVGAIRSRRGRRMLGAVLATVIAVPALVAGTGVFTVVAITQSHQAKQRAGQHDAERASSVSDDEIATSLRETEGTIVPQSIYAAVAKSSARSVDVDELSDAMQ